MQHTKTLAIHPWDQEANAFVSWFVNEDFNNIRDLIRSTFLDWNGQTHWFGSIDESEKAEWIACGYLILDPEPLNPHWREL